MNKSYDVIIVGTGAAGLYAALALPRDYQILMISKDTLTNSDSYLAQGGISTLLNEEDYNEYFEDTMKAGHYENNKESVQVMISKSSQIIHSLIEYGVDFDLKKDGEFDYTREGGHSVGRILHRHDNTGKEIVTKLLGQVQKRENITLLSFAVMLDIIHENNICYGIVMKYKEGPIQQVYADNVILATGGLGGLFKNSTNFSHITGDSFAIALKNNVELENIHYIQIHPTALYSPKKGRRFLISESVRGEGAVLLNEEKERFVNELLPRDIVSEAIFKEMKRYQTDHVYLRLTSMTSEEAKKRFPKIYNYCLEEGYKLGKDDIPVTPAQHYLMGGIKTNQKGKTSMNNLYAVGETACNGVHGTNRLASNSLLESLVFAKEAAISIVTESLKNKKPEYTGKQEQFIFDFETLDHNKIVLNEIKRKDNEFYAKWCNNED